MQFLLLIHETPGKVPAEGTPGQAAYFAEWGRAVTELQQAGVMVGGAPLAPVTDAVSVRGTDGGPEHASGPLVPAADVLSGYLVLEVPDVAAATAWADRLPNVHHGSGGVEVRAAVPMAVPA